MATYHQPGSIGLKLPSREIRRTASGRASPHVPIRLRRGTLGDRSLHRTSELNPDICGKNSDLAFAFRASNSGLFASGPVPVVTFKVAK